MCDKNGISRGEGESVLGVNFWKIQRGWGVIGKIPSVGGVWIFSGTTHLQFVNNIQVTFTFCSFNTTMKIEMVRKLVLNVGKVRPRV